MDTTSPTQLSKQVEVENSMSSEVKPSANSVKCPVCGYMNPANQALCTKCQSVLNLSASSNETAKLAPGPDMPGVPKYGSTQVEKQLILHISDSMTPLEITLEERSFVIGRYDAKTGSTPDIDLAPYGADSKGVSRKHATLTYHENALKISDLASANFTYLNGHKLVPNQSRIVRDGDEIRLGHLKIMIQFGERQIG